MMTLHHLDRLDDLVRARLDERDAQHQGDAVAEAAAAARAAEARRALLLPEPVPLLRQPVLG